jgi:preprotein translocase subunit SecF
MSRLFFEFIPNTLKIDFMGKAKYMLVLGTLLVTGSLVSLFTRGLNYGVDFEGGTQLNLKFSTQVTASELRAALSKLGLEDSMVQEMGERQKGEFLIRVPSQQTDLTRFKDPLQKAANSVSPQPGTPAKLRFSEDRLYVGFAAAVAPEKLKSAINALQIPDLAVHNVDPFGRASDYEYRVQISGIANRIVTVFEESFGARKFEVLQVDYVGPKVGKALRMQAIGAILISLVLILIYVWFRFEFEFAPGAVICLFHDATIIIGVFSFFQLSFDLSIVAAVLTIIGFSINDTIVIYDRIRENLQRTRNPDLPQVINDSVNQTLSRTILTSGTVLLTSLAILFFGGPITQNFALAFTIGLIAGSYSTISVAAPITIYVQRFLHRQKGA